MLIISAAGLVSCSRRETAPAPPPIPADVLATVGDERITAAEFQTAMARRRVGNDPGAKHSLLDEMVRSRALVQEAKARGYDKDPQVIAAYNNLLATKVREVEEQKIRAQAKVTPAEVEAYYNEHVAEFTIPTKVRGAVIFVEGPASFTLEAKAERLAAMEAARQKARALPVETQGFGAVAAEFSYDQATKFHGGDMGYMTEGATVQGWEKPVVDALFALKDYGQLSDVITTDKGYYLIKLTERKPGSVRPLASLRGPIERKLTAEKEKQLTASAMEELTKGRAVKVYDDRLTNIAPLAGSKPADEQDAVPSMPGQ